KKRLMLKGEVRGARRAQRYARFTVAGSADVPDGERPPSGARLGVPLLRHERRPGRRRQLRKHWGSKRRASVERREFDSKSTATPANCAQARAERRMMDLPVISVGLGRPISSSSVGAMSASLPSANDTSFPSTSTTG